MLIKKEKKLVEKYEENEWDARNIVFLKPYKNWIKNDFKIAIKYKQGLKAPNNKKWNQTSTIAVLRSFYERHYKGRPRLGPPGKIQWTAENERKLNRLLSGEINSVEETAMYGRALDGHKSFLVRRTLNLCPETRVEIISKIIDEMGSWEKTNY